MTVLLGLAFALVGVIAVAAIAGSLSQYAHRLGALRRALQQPPLIEELRVTVCDHMPEPGPQKRQAPRRKRQDRPAKHRQNNRIASSAAA
jgi:hypothetical protein